MRRLALLLIVMVALGGALALPGAASAAPCAAGLTVVGIPVTGADCVDLGAGAIEIDTPRLLTNQVVEIRGKMNLNAARDLLKQKSVATPLVLAVKNQAGTYTPFMVGTYQVGRFRFCELFKGFAPSTGSSLPTVEFEGIPFQTNDRLDVARVQVGCVENQPAIDVTQPALQGAIKLLNLKASLDPVFQTDSGVRTALPTTFGLDEARGGRIFGNVTVAVPLRGGTAANIGLTVEQSQNEGLKPVSLSAAYTGGVNILPAVRLESPAVVIDPVNKRYGGRLRLRFPLKIASAGAELLVENGQLKRIGADVALPPPGIPIPPPSPSSVPLITISSFGATLVTADTATDAVGGGTIAQRGSFQGRMSFTAGPLVAVPGGQFQAFTADLDLTISGPTVQLRGTLFAINKLIRFGSARLQIGADPFRMEAEANVAFPNTSVTLVSGDVFLGVTGRAFTGLGTLTIQIPSSIVLIGGQQLGGFSGVVSDKAIGGVISVDVPLLKPRTVGVVFKYGGGFDFVDSITPFITVTPTPIGFIARRTGFASQSGTASSFTLPAGKGDVAVQIEGSGVAPTGVSITGPDGKSVKAAKLPSNDPKLLVLGLSKPAAGAYKVNGSGIAKVVVATLDDPSYLDPRPGWGSRPKPPIKAGDTVPVCWDIKHAPAGAVVDLFEDTNGFAATGRDIATGLPPSGCFDIPTADWEPGRHWAYGQVRVGDTPLSLRYWPIGITVVDPARLAAPAGLKATRTKDGATLKWGHVEGASGYQVTAIAANPQDAPVHKEIVDDAKKPSTKLSLRGARKWTVSVQAIAGEGALGNVSKVVTTGATVPVVLAGRPNGTPQVGKAWAFQLDTENLSSLKVLKAPKGTRLNRAKGLLTWTPSAAAGKADPQVLSVKGCSRDKRCVTQQWKVTAYAKSLAPAGPARSFKVLDSVVKPGETIELRAQGVDEKVTVRIDGKRVKASAEDEQTIAVRLPKTLGKGPHDVSLRIGGDLEEKLTGAIVVL
jgi:hypothetical protein